MILCARITEAGRGARQHRAIALPPNMPGEFLRHGLAELRRFSGEEVRPVGGAGDAFAVGGAEGSGKS